MYKNFAQKNFAVISLFSFIAFGLKAETNSDVIESKINEESQEIVIAKEKEEVQKTQNTENVDAQQEVAAAPKEEAQQENKPAEKSMEEFYSTLNEEEQKRCQAMLSKVEEFSKNAKMEFANEMAEFESLLVKLQAYLGLPALSFDFRLSVEKANN